MKARAMCWEQWLQTQYSVRVVVEMGIILGIHSHRPQTWNTQRAGACPQTHSLGNRPASPMCESLPALPHLPFLSSLSSVPSSLLDPSKYTSLTRHFSALTEFAASGRKCCANTGEGRGDMVHKGGGVAP